MNNFIVCTDSGCDLALNVLRKADIQPLHMLYEIDGVTYSDSMLPEDYHAFYQKMRDGAVPKTSQVNINQYLEFWRPLLKQGLPIVHITLGSGVSGTYQNGVLAAAELKKEDPSVEIHVVDSTLCSVAYGILALKAAEMRDAGATAAECAAWLEANKATMQTWYTTDELKYFYRSGRVRKASMILGTALSINPILNLDVAGHLLVQEKVRGIKHTERRLLEIVVERVRDAGSQIAYICHSDVPERARRFGETLMRTLSFRDVVYSDIGPTIGTHCGPGVITVSFWGKARDMKGYKGD